jgi:hypothetical protein
MKALARDKQVCTLPGRLKQTYLFVFNNDNDIDKQRQQQKQATTATSVPHCH